jgi:hypothetical protein
MYNMVTGNNEAFRELYLNTEQGINHRPNIKRQGYWPAMVTSCAAMGREEDSTSKKLLVDQPRQENTIRFYTTD